MTHELGAVAHAVPKLIVQVVTELLVVNLKELSVPLTVAPVPQEAMVGDEAEEDTMCPRTSRVPPGAVVPIPTCPPVAVPLD